MKKYLETKTVSQISEKWKSKNNNNSSRRFTIAAGAMPHIDKFEEMARNIALKRTDKSYSYNISRSLSEENECHNNQRRKFSVQNSVHYETPHHEKEYPSNYKSNDIKNIKSPRQKRRSSIVTGRKPSLTVPVDLRETSVAGDKRNIGSTHMSRYHHFAKRLKSPTAERRKSLKDFACFDDTCETHTDTCKTSVDTCKTSMDTCKTHRKAKVLYKHSSGTKEPDKLNNGTCGHGNKHNGMIATNLKSGHENSKVVTKETNEKRATPSLKMISSDSKLSSDSESSSMIDNDTSCDGNISTDSASTQLSPPVLDVDCSRRKRSDVYSVSPVRSRVSSGSRKSSLSQRSELSVTSTASTGSLADKIIESRALKMREMLRDRESGSLESQDFLPPHFTCRRFSVNSEGSRGDEPFDMFQKGFRSAASYPILNITKNNQTKSESNLELCQESQGGKKTHLPDEVPKEGENSVPIRLYKRKQIRKVLEA